MKIALLGDMALIGRYDLTKDTKAQERLSVVKNIVKDCDFIIANLESPFTSKKHTLICKGVYLKSDPVNVETLKYLGITHVSLANNHTFDYGVKGAKETIKTLEDNGISYVGLCNEPALLVKDGERALIEGFCCYSANGVRYGHNKKMHLRTLCKEDMVHFLEKAAMLNAFPIVSAHFGIEGVNHPSVEHMNFFRSFTKDHNYVLHGNHPHAIQGYEKHNKSLLYYACGDLCFDDATITSINSPAIQSDDSRRSYITIIDINNNSASHTTTVCISDLPDGFVKINDEVQLQLDSYASDLNKTQSEIKEIRKHKLSASSSSRQKKDMKFIIDRLNLKYIGAYINLKIHTKHYNKLFSNYFQEL